MAPECLRRTKLSEVGWQSIPRLRSCDTEFSVSELPIGPWHDEIATVCGDHVHETVPQQLG